MYLLQLYLQSYKVNQIKTGYRISNNYKEIIKIMAKILFEYLQHLNNNNDIGMRRNKKSLHLYRVSINISYIHRSWL
jgi:hypothetical protein